MGRRFKKILLVFLGLVILFLVAGYSFIYYVPYSEGVRSGELIKFSRKGVLIKTWEGEISQGISGAQIFSFSVLDKEKGVIDDLVQYEGRYIKLYYVEKYRTFFWWGDSNYFITKVEENRSPHIEE
ncbi:MAG: 6-phosphogluconate dehydrogenase [Flavobacteriaceae bacterium]